MVMSTTVHACPAASARRRGRSKASNGAPDKKQNDPPVQDDGKRATTPPPTCRTQQPARKRRPVAEAPLHPSGAVPRNGAHSRPSAHRAHRCRPRRPPRVPSAGCCTRVVIKGAIAHQPRQRGLVVGQPARRPRVLGRRRPRLRVPARGAGLELGRAHADTPWGGLESPTGRHAHPATPAATTTADRTAASSAVGACFLRAQMVHHARRTSRPSRRPRVGRPPVGRGRPSGPPYW